MYSIKSDLHTYAEDYEIASQIANHYGFELNRSLPEHEFLNYSLSDAFNSDLYINRTFSNIPKLATQKSIDKTYHITGAAGETIRNYWNVSQKKFIEGATARTKIYSRNLARESSESIKNILESGFRSVRNKHGINDKDSPHISHLLYQESRCRYHFGKDALCNYFTNTVRLSPLLDPEVRTLRLDTPECPDANLLIALLFTRYEPDILKFPFNGNHFIDPKTIAFAQKINERFPRKMTTDTVDRGGGFTYSRVTRVWKKSLLRGATINLFRAACLMPV